MPGQTGEKTTRPDLSFRVAVGRRIKEERERKQIRQELVALIGRRWGLSWSANTIAQLETGRRRLLAEEWVLLPVVLTEALNPSPEPYRFEDLIPGSIKAQIALTSETRCYPKGLISLLGECGVLAHEDAKYFDRPHSRRQQALMTRGGRGGISIPSDKDFSETDYKASRVLGVAPTAVVTAALRLWQRSLMEERDRRLAETGQTALTRRTQALKAHITRRLLQELRPALRKLGLKPTAKKKMPKGGST